MINIKRITNVVLPTYILPRCRNEIPFLHIIMHDKIEIMNSFFYFFPRMPYLFSVFSLLFQFFFFIKMSFVMHVYIFSRIMIRFCWMQENRNLAVASLERARHTDCTNSKGIYYYIRDQENIQMAEQWQYPHVIKENLYVRWL